MSDRTLRDDQRLVQELCDIESGLTKWEVDFVESISSRVEDDGQELTPGQREKAKDILERRGGR